MEGYETARDAALKVLQTGMAKAPEPETSGWLWKAQRFLELKACSQGQPSGVEVSQAAAGPAREEPAQEAEALASLDILEEAKVGNLEAVRSLLRADPDSLQKRDEDGNSALHLAAWQGHSAVVAALLEARADVETSGQYGRTPLWLAAFQGHVDVAQLLLGAGAAVDAAHDSNGWTPLHFAAYGGHAALVELLLGAGAAVDAADEDGTTPLHQAVRNGHAALVELLLGAGAAVDVTDKYGRTPLRLAANYDRVDAAQLLLGAGAAVDAADEDGWTPLHATAREGHAALVELLLGAGAAVDVTDKYGQTPLWYAADQGHVDAAQLLLGAGAAVDAADGNGMTPLHAAAYQGHAALVELLLGAGAAVDATDMFGKTPLDLALENEQEDVVRLLRPVFVTLLSGRTARCDPSHATVQDLLEEAQKKLEIKISHLITSAESGHVLQPSLSLKEAQLAEGGHVNAVILQEAEPEPAFAPSHHAGYGLQDPKSFIRFLMDADVALVRLDFFKQLQQQNQRLPRRQEAETASATGKCLVSREDLAALRVDQHTGRVWNPQGEPVTFLSVSHVWESMEHPDPWGFQLDKVVAYCEALAGEVFLFYDYLSLFQYKRNEIEQISFQKALEGMHQLYSHEVVQVQIIRDLTPPELKSSRGSDGVKVYCEAADQVVWKTTAELRLNDTPYEERGWCAAETEWSQLRTDLEGAVPTPPYLFQERLSLMRFTHRNDSPAVLELQRKVFEEKVQTTENLMLRSMDAKTLKILRAALPSYTQLHSLVANGVALTRADAVAMAETGADLQLAACGLGDDAALALAQVLADTPAAARSICLARNRFSQVGLQALRALQEQQPRLQLDLSEQDPEEANA